MGIPGRRRLYSTRKPRRTPTALPPLFRCLTAINRLLECMRGNSSKAFEMSQVSSRCERGQAGQASPAPCISLSCALLLHPADRESFTLG